MSALPSRRARLEAMRRAEQLSAEQEALLVAQAGAAARAVALVSVVLGEAAQSFKICRGGGEEELISFQYVAAAAGLGGLRRVEWTFATLPGEVGRPNGTEAVLRQTSGTC